MSASTNVQKEQPEMTEAEIHQKRVEELDTAEVSANVDLKLLFDTLTHCAEPEDAEAILANIDGGSASPPEADQKEREAAEKEHAEGSYRVKFNDRHYPADKHPTWPATFVLHVDEEEGFFYVLKSENDQSEEGEVYPTTFDPEDPKTRIGEFGYRYECGEKARDKDGNLMGKENGEIEFNYAEHKMIGEMLHLRFSKTDTRLGTTLLSLPDNIKLSYGEINGLGGDFFGGYHPVCTGANFEEQCEFFREAFGTLSGGKGAKQKVSDLLKGREAEVEAISRAVENGTSTFKAYKGLNHQTDLGFTEEDARDQLNTLSADGPSYLVLAQLNLDHFGAGARTAYAAGHYEALKKAAEGSLESLETAYTMNAFADHYLGDLFASGHFRTPRRLLHGSNTKWGAAWDAFSGAIQAGGREGLMKAMAPDLLSMLMHNEDNKRGIMVKNPQGKKFAIWGDKQLFEPQNATGKEMMRQALQASVDEVYEAYESRSAKLPWVGQGFRAFNYTPNEAVESESHSPLFKEYKLSTWEKVKLWWPVQVREPFTDPFSKNYKPIGGSAALIELYNKINGSEMWKEY